MNIKALSIASLSSLTLVFSLSAVAGETMEQAEAAASESTAIEAQTEAMVDEAQIEAMVEAAPAMASEATSETEASAADVVQVEAQVEAEAKPKKDFDEKVAEYNKDKGKKDKVVCRREKKTGSHFSRRRCVTAAQAEREREDAQDALQRASRGTNTGPTN